MTSNTITDKDQAAGGKQLFTETPSGATFVPPDIGGAGRGAGQGAGSSLAGTEISILPELAGKLSRAAGGGWQPSQMLQYDSVSEEVGEEELDIKEEEEEKALLVTVNLPFSVFKFCPVLCISLNQYY